MTKPGSNLTRRDFLTASASCLASAALAGSAAATGSAGPEPAEPDNTKSTIPTRRLARTDIDVPLVSGGAGAANDPGLIQASFESGMYLFDTDARYQHGRHEQLLGRAFSRMGVRDRVVIMTKVHTPEQRAGLSGEESKKLLTETFEGSLKRLRTDYVDILLVHHVSDRRTIRDPAILEALTRLKRQGKARAIGTATHENMTVAINATAEDGVYDIVLTTINFTMADDRKLLEAIDNAARKGVGVIAMKTQAGGYSFPNPGTLRTYSSAVVNSAALKWVCHNRNIASSIPGIATYDHLRANLAVALNWEYTDEEKRFLSDNLIKLGMEFCRQCRKCVATCPRNADVPTLMRTHMYAQQYRDFGLARQTLDTISSNRSLSACAACGECSAACANSVNIPRKINELKLLYA
jgi:predicted aldo/keto reductase-like oxidoreductase